MGRCGLRRIRLPSPPPMCSATGCRLILGLLTEVLQPQSRRLERRFLERLRRLGYDPRQRKALAAITPGAASALSSSRRWPPDFIEQVEYNGRRLAQLNLAPARIVHALHEYHRLLDPFADSLDAGVRSGLTRALEQWYFCVVLTLNNAFYRVAETETQTYHELFRIELESKGLDELLHRMLEALSRYCRAEAGALYLLDPKTSAWLLKAATLEEVATGPGGAGRGNRELSATVGKGRCATRRQRAAELALRPALAGHLSNLLVGPAGVRGPARRASCSSAFRAPTNGSPGKWNCCRRRPSAARWRPRRPVWWRTWPRREEQVRRLAERLLQVEERERRRISTELHDEAGQSLLCIRLQLELLERCVPASCAHLARRVSARRARSRKRPSSKSAG